MRSRKPKRRTSTRATPLTVVQILAWADQWRRRFGTWPRVLSGRIPGALGEKWVNVDMALRLGLRGLEKGSSLIRLLADHRGARNPKSLPNMTVPGILAWADAHHRRTGAWPNENSGSIVDAPGETWIAVCTALGGGARGLPGGSSLARVLAQHRGVRNRGDLPRLTQKQVLVWADAHFQRTGEWPTNKSGPIPDASGENWNTVALAMHNGQRGFKRHSSLARLLHRCRGVRNLQDLAPLAIATILAWADAHHRRTGKWPNAKAGPIQEAPGETWSAVVNALHVGSRGLRRRSSLATVLARHRGVPNVQDLPASLCH
jgi:hypothetical protein